jgi:hypothetical protein
VLAGGQQGESHEATGVSRVRPSFVTRVAIHLTRSAVVMLGGMSMTLPDGGASRADDPVGGGLQVQDLGSVWVAGLVLAEPVAAGEHRVIGWRPGLAERFHCFQHGGFAAAGRGLKHQPGVGHDVGDGLIGDDHCVLAGGAQLRRQLGGEQVDLGLQVEDAFVVDDDFLDKRAVPGSSTVATWMPRSR